jgi:tRNA A-37 threonylcarbamoyl transferase component Bud32
MAELTVQIRYPSHVRLALLTLLKLTFPLWGVVAPVGSVICFVILINSLTNGSTPYHSSIDWYTIFRMFGMFVAGLATPASLLMLTRSLSNDRIVIDKDALIMPWAGNQRILPWNKLKRITVDPPVAADQKAQRLLLFSDDGKTLALGLGRIEQAEVEQLLLAIDMWAPTCEKDPSVESLKECVKQIAPQSAELSYTNMWEEELRRRFCAAAFMPLEPGTHLRNGSLKVVRQLALGGLSALYLCQLDGSKLVVLKEAVIPEESAENIRAKAQEMFQREAALLMKLNHPNIVKVLDCFLDAGRHYLLLEYLNGQDIRQYVKQNGPQKEHVVIEWAIHVAGILKYLHEQDPPIIHRDLTPDNLVVRTDGSIVLIDFGAANELIANSTGTFVGKQSFIAPEQFRGKAVTQSDIYTFGCTLHFLLTGQEPEALETSCPRDLNSGINEELNEFVVCCTQMEPRDRYQSAAQMLPVLKRMAASLLVS